jgi:alpha-tubulin suppressor-like RCC1 family protein
MKRFLLGSQSLFGRGLATACLSRQTAGVIAAVAALLALSSMKSAGAGANGTATITGQVFGQTLTLQTYNQYAGAVSSLVWNGVEFVNRYDHGRQFQTCISGFNRAECYNPTEGGSANDGWNPTSTSYLESISASNNILTTRTWMAFFLAQGQSGACGNPAAWESPAPLIPADQLSNYVLNKTVKIGFNGIPNVIEYLSTVEIPEASRSSYIENIAIMPREFGETWTYDLVSKGYRIVRATGGEDDSVKVRVRRDGSTTHALGLYSPELLQPYENSGFRWSIVDGAGGPNGFGCATAGGLTRFYMSGPGSRSFRTYWSIGSKEQVKDGLDALHLQYTWLDRDVFNWRDYHIIYPDVAGVFPSQEGAQFHWSTYGIGESRSGSRTFSPKDYLTLNPDVAGAYGATNYAGAIYHYIWAGRGEGRSTVAQISCGTYHTLNLTDRILKGAGYNYYGQVGTGSTTPYYIPTPDPMEAVENVVTEVVAGEYTSFAVYSDGTLWMWGSNAYGARGNGAVGGSITTPVQVPFPAGVKIMTPTRNGKHAVAIGGNAYAAVDTEGQVWTWGNNLNGRLGDGTNVNRYTPARVKGGWAGGDFLTGITSITAGGGTMAALDADAKVWTWGKGANGQLGNWNYSNSDRWEPVHLHVCQADYYVTGCAPVALVGVTQVEYGASGFGLALGRGGQVYAWGNNANGQLGLAGGGSRYMAIPVGSLPFVTSIATGVSHSLALGRDGYVYGWGYNNRGQLGRGNTSNAEAVPARMQTPLEITPDPSIQDHEQRRRRLVSSIAAGGYYSIVTNTFREVWVTGDNIYGQLGRGNTSQPLVLTKSNLW